MTDQADIARLERTIAALTDRVAALECGGDGIVPALMAIYGLTPLQAQVVALLLKRPVSSRAALYMTLYGHRDDGPDDKVIDVAIYHLRLKLGPHGIPIKSLHRQGWMIRRADANTIHARLRAWSER